MTSDVRIVQREVINEFIDLVWEQSSTSKYGRPRIYVAGHPFLTCSFLIVKVDPTDPINEGATVEQLADRPGASVLEGQDAVGTTIDGYTLSKEDVMFGFRSSIEGWIRNDYDTQCLAANLSFPLLKEVAQAGDKKAQRVLQAEIIKRLKEDYPATTIVVLETCMNVIDEDTTAWIVKHLIEPHLGEVESEKLNWFVKIGDLSIPLATALLGSKDDSVRKQAIRDMRRFKELLSDQEKRLVMNVLKHETKPWVIQEFVSDIRDPVISAAIVDTLLKGIQHYQPLIYRDHWVDRDEVLDRYTVIKSIVAASVTSPETLGKIMDFARFKSMTDIEDSLDSQFHAFPMFDRRSTLIEAVIYTHHAPDTSFERAIGMLKLIEDTREAAGELMKLRSNTKKAQDFLAAAARSLRRAITSEPAAGPFLMPLITTVVHHYHSLRAIRSETGKGWDVSGMTRPGSAGYEYRSANYQFKSNWEFEEFLRYTGLKPAGGQANGDVVDLAGTYTLTLVSGTWKSLQDFAEMQGMKMGRAPFVVPLLAYRVYESVYFKDGNVFRLDEYCTPSARLWSRTGSEESGYQWKPVLVSKKLADYMR